MTTTLFTVGHSNHAIAAFIALLRTAEINLIADVRSIPYSRRLPHFRRAAFEAALTAAGIGYAWCGEALGGRPRDEALLRHGKPDYRAIAAQPQFQAALESVAAVASDRRTALMCAERDPLDCHRFHLLAAPLAAGGLDIVHLHADGTQEGQAAAAARLARRNPQGRLFA